VAEATISLLRVRRVRVDLLNEFLHDLDVPQPPPAETPWLSLPRPPSTPTTVAAARADEEEGPTAVSARTPADDRDDHRVKTSVKDLHQEWGGGEQQGQQRATQRSTAWERLEKLERYEHRALSQRRMAIKALDALREP
jgi:hypothetical protein